MRPGGRCGRTRDRYLTDSDEVHPKAKYLHRTEVISTYKRVRSAARPFADYQADGCQFRQWPAYLAKDG